MPRETKPAVVIVGHGSLVPGFAAPLKKVAGVLRSTGRFGRVLCAYLSVNKPSIPEAIRRCVRGGAQTVKVLPYFLLSGKHVTRDMPLYIKEANRLHRGKAKVKLCPYLGFDGKIAQVVLKRLGGSVA